MHPLCTPPGAPSSGALAYFPSSLGDFGQPISTWDEASMKTPFHVLSVGRIELRSLIRNASSIRRHSRFPSSMTIASYRSLRSNTPLMSWSCTTLSARLNSQKLPV